VIFAAPLPESICPELSRLSITIGLPEHRCQSRNRQPEQIKNSAMPAIPFGLYWTEKRDAAN
jgi:hypothetical protein